MKIMTFHCAGYFLKMDCIRECCRFIHNNYVIYFRKIPPFAWLSCCWGNETRSTDHQGRCLRYTHTNTDSSSVTDTFSTTSARRMNTLHSSIPSIRHVQLRLPPTTNSNLHNVHTTASIL